MEAMIRLKKEPFLRVQTLILYRFRNLKKLEVIFAIQYQNYMKLTADICSFVNYPIQPEIRTPLRTLNQNEQSSILLSKNCLKHRQRVLKKERQDLKIIEVIENKQEPQPVQKRRQENCTRSLDSNINPTNIKRELAPQKRHRRRLVTIEAFQKSRPLTCTNSIKTFNTIDNQSIRSRSLKSNFQAKLNVFREKTSKKDPKKKIKVKICTSQLELQQMRRVIGCLSQLK